MPKYALSGKAGLARAEGLSAPSGPAEEHFALREYQSSPAVTEYPSDRVDLVVGNDEHRRIGVADNA